MKLTLYLATLLLCATLAQSHERKTGTSPLTPGATLWGDLEIKGRSVTIFGHPRWDATGTLQENGILKLLWIERDSGRVGHGRYVIDGDAVTGTWGFIENVEWTDDGRLVGNVLNETLRTR